MKAKREYIVLIAIIIVLAAVYGLQQNVKNKKAETLPQTPIFAATDLTRIEIVTPEAELVMGRDENGGWVLLPHGYPVEERLSSIMTEGLANFKVTAVISESDRDYPRYQLDDARKVLVKAYTGENQVLNFNLGAVVAGNLRHNYVKLNGDPKVYHGRGNLRTFFDTNEFELRQKQVLKFNVNDIDEIALSAKGTELAIKSQTVTDVDGNEIKIWLGPGDFYVESGLVETFLGFVADTNVYDFLPISEEDLGPERYTLSLLDYDNAKEHVLYVYGPDESREYDDEYSVMYRCRSSDVLSPFYLAFAQQSDIMKRFGEMLTGSTENAPVN